MGLLKIEASSLFEKNYQAKAKTIVNVGGARSGKSYALAQLLLTKGLTFNGCNIGITRKTLPALKMTAYRLFIDMLKKHGLYKADNHNKTEHFYMLDKTRVQFFSLDDPEKIKSSEFNYIWIEEATEFSYKDYITLLTRLSAPNPYDKNHLYLTLNPSDCNSWINTKLLPSLDCQIIKSNYKDNPFLDKSYIKTLVGLKEMDEASYKIFALGEWAQKKETIYNNYSFIDSVSEDCQNVIWGLDFGFNNPSALVRIQILDKGLEVEEKLYQTGLTTSQLKSAILEIIPEKERHQEIYADAAEPDRIKELYDAGLNIYPANKTVNVGILKVKSKPLFITKNSVNLIKEIQSYSWKTDLNGNVLEEPVKFNDHALDALRYAVHSYFQIWENPGKLIFI